MTDTLLPMTSTRNRRCGVLARKWSPRRTLLFLIGANTSLWTMLVGGAVAIIH